MHGYFSIKYHVFFFLFFFLTCSNRCSNLIGKKKKGLDEDEDFGL